MWIGDREHVEAVASVEIAELADAVDAVAPGRVHVKIATNILKLNDIW